MVKLSFDDPPSQELGSADSSLPEDLDYLLDPPRCTIPWLQDRTASPELFGDAIDLDDNLLLDSHRWSQVPTTQIVRMFEQSWKEPSFQDFGADNSFQAFICSSPRYTFPWQQDWIASPEFFGSSISSDANSQPYVSKEQRVLFIPPAKMSVKGTIMQAAFRSLFQWRLKKPIAEVEEIIAQSPLFSKELTLQITQLAICSPPPITLPNGGDTVQLDSSEQQSLVEFDATNNGHVVSQDHSSSTGSHSKKKNTDHLKNNTKETLEIQRRNKIKLSLEDIKQQFVNKREDAAKNLGVSVPTLKRTCRKYRINRWPYCKENKGSYKGMGVRFGRGTSSSAQAARSTKRFAPAVPASSSRKRLRSSSQIATPRTTSTDDAMAKSTDPVIHEIDEHGDDGRTLHQLIHWSEPLRMLPLKREKYSGFRKSQTSIVDRESKFTDFGEQAREVEGNKGESAGGEDGVEEEEDSVESELSRGNSRVREELEEDRDEVQCCEHVEVEMLSVELAENVIDLLANQPSVHPVDIPSLAKEDATPSKPALLQSLTTPERPPNPAYPFSFWGTPLSLSAHLVTMTSADQTVPANFPLQGAVGAASAVADPACSGQASNDVTRQSHLQEISKKSQFLEFEVSSKAFPLLTQIQQRFPETFTSFKIKRSEWAVSMLGNLAEFVKSVADTKVHETSEETMQAMHGSLEDLENMGFSLPWLKARLEDGTKVKKHNENNISYECYANALEKIKGDIKKLDEDYVRASSKLIATKEKLEVDTAKAKAGLDASGRDLPSSLFIGDSLLKGIIM